MPSLFSSPTLFFPYAYFEHGVGYVFFAIITVFILICVWLIGLVAILFLQNKSVAIQPQSEITDHKPLAGELPVEARSSRKVQHNRAYLYVVATLLIITLAVSSYSFFNIYHGYKILIHESNGFGDEDCQYSNFTFEYPKNFYESVPWDVIL